jgi:hypothetical protein
MFYYLRRQQVALKNRKDPNEKYLFHGSRVGAYEIIRTPPLLVSVCLDTVLDASFTCNEALSHLPPASLCAPAVKDGFDHRVANMGGAIGAGVYFATHASTSTGYVTGGHAKKVRPRALSSPSVRQLIQHNSCAQMLYCRVTLGSVGTGKVRP